MKHSKGKHILAIKSQDYLKGFREGSFLIYLFISLLILALGQLYPRHFEKTRQTIISRAASGLDVLDTMRLNLAKLEDSLSGFYRVYQENKELKETIDKIREEQLYAHFIISTNRQLEELLKLKADEKMNTVASTRIIANFGNAYNNKILLTAGQNEGASEGDAVICNQGLVGLITKVSDEYSEVLLITDPRAKVPVFGADSGEKAILSGKQSGGLHLELITNIHQFKPGEMLYTTGDGMYYPAGIFVGIVDSINGEKVTVKSFVKWNQLHFVKIVTSRKNI